MFLQKGSMAKLYFLAAIYDDFFLQKPSSFFLHLFEKKLFVHPLKSKTPLKKVFFNIKVYFMSIIHVFDDNQIS